MSPKIKHKYASTHCDLQSQSQNNIDIYNDSICQTKLDKTFLDKVLCWQMFNLILIAFLFRKVRREVVDCMRQLMKLAKERSGEGMFPIVEEMLKKTKLICSIPDSVLMEEALVFLEENKITKRPEKDEFSDSVAEFMQRNKLKIDIEGIKHNCGSMQTPCTEFICKVIQNYFTTLFSKNI